MTWRSLTFQLLAIVVFPLIILLLVITFASTTMHENAMRDLVGQRDERAARMASTAIKEQIEWRMNEIQGIADQVAYASPDRASEVLQNTAYLKDEFDAGLAILDQHGQIIALRGDAAIWQGEGNWLDEAIRSLKTDPALPVFAVSPIDQADFESPLMVVIAPVRDRQYFAAGAFFTSPLVADVFASLTSAEHETSIALITSGGKILYSQGHNLQSEGVIEHAGASEALAGRHGTTYVNVGDSEHVIAYSPVEPFGWALLIEEPWEHVVSPLLQTTLLAPLVMVPVLLLALLALFFGIRQIVQPLQALAVQASHLGWGDYQAIEKPAGGVSEIRQLQLELIHMAQKVQAAQRSLHSYIGAITSGHRCPTWRPPAER